tara:strand:+ start:1387 stop:3441 length:2055 start_codon:yes stop_codon:yes gene_type:complete
MPTYSSPGNYVIEKDFSEYAPAVNSSIAGIVGFASRGPANKATLITSAAQLIRTFGETKDTEGGQGLLAALEILSKTNSMYYVRAEDGTTASDASAGVAYGSCPAVYVSGIGAADITFAFSSTDQAGTSNTPNGDGYLLPVTIGASVLTDPAAAVLSAQAGIETNNWAWTAVSGLDSSSVWFVNNHAGADATLQVSASVAGLVSNVDSKGLASVVVASNVIASGTTALATAAGGVYFVESIHSGGGYNASAVTTVNGVTNKGLKVQVDSKSGKNFQLSILDAGVVAEGFTMNFEKNGTSTFFPEDVLNIGETDTKSEFVKASFMATLTKAENTWVPPTSWANKSTGTFSVTYNSATDSAATPRFMKMVDGTYDMTDGANGDFTTAGEVTGTAKSAMIGSPSLKTGIYALDDDSLNISMAAVPGFTQQDVQNTLITLAESSQNFLAVVSPPEGLTTAQKAVNWHNGQGDARTAAINSSYAAIYWPWLKQFDPATSTDIYMDPAAYAISMMCHTDSVSDPWFAPAGLVRGRLTKPTDVEVILNVGDRDSLYQPGNSVNPIAKFARDGIVIWGQKTAQRTPSALDRVNVRRMMIVIRKMILAATRSIVFEPNDPFTWNRIVQLLQPALNDIKIRRGITEFKVVCDSTTNTPLRIDRNELWCRVMIKPTKTAEVLIFELNLMGQSASI